MLPKSRRLTRTELYQVKSSHHTYRNSYLSSSYSPTPNPKYAVVTSAKLTKKAVLRNRLRRDIYSALVLNTTLPSLSIIFYPQPSMLNLSRAEIASQVDSFISSLPRS